MRDALAALGLDVFFDVEAMEPGEAFPAAFEPHPWGLHQLHGDVWECVPA